MAATAALGRDQYNCKLTRASTLLILLFQGCESDIEMTDQSYHQKTELENDENGTHANTQVWRVPKNRAAELHQRTIVAKNLSFLFVSNRTSRLG